MVRIRSHKPCNAAGDKNRSLQCGNERLPRSELSAAHAMADQDQGGNSGDIRRNLTDEQRRERSVSCYDEEAVCIATT